MRFSTKIIRNAIANYVGQFVTLALGLFLTPFMIHHLGDTQFGIWSLALSLFAWLSVLDMVLSTGAGKYVAEYEALGNQERINQMVSTLLFVYLAIAALALVPVLVLAPKASQVFKIEDSYASLSAIVFFIGGLNFVVGFPSSVLNAALVGHQRIDLNNLISVAATVANAALVVVAFSLGFGLISLALITLTITALTAVLRLHYLKRANPQITLRPQFFQTRIVVALAAYGVFVFLNYIGTGLQFEVDNIIVGRFIDVAQVTHFTVARKLSRFVLFVGVPLMGVFFPAFSELGAVTDLRRAQMLLIEGTRVSLALSAPLSVVLWVMAGPIISLWIGAGYNTNTTVTVTMILVGSVLANVIYAPASSLLFGMAKHRGLAVINLVAGTVSLGLSIVLAWSMGPVGVALGAFIPIVGIGTPSIIYYACSVISLPVSKLLRESVIPTLVPGLFLALLAFVLVRLWYPDHVLVLLAEVTVCFLVYGIAYFVFLSDKDRGIYLSNIQALLQQYVRS